MLTVVESEPRRSIYFVPSAIGHLVDRYTLSVWANRSEETIRRRCPVQEYHRDGRALYVADACLALLSDMRHDRNRLGERLTDDRRSA